MKYKEYILRLCKKDEYEKLIDFIKNYWGTNHVFCRNKIIFEFQHGDAGSGEYDFIVAVHNQTQEFHAVLGYISSSTYDGGDPTNPEFVCGALWKVRDDIHNKEIGKLGLGVLYYLLKLYPDSDYITIGLSGFSQQIYDSLHFDFGKMKHYYIASNQLTDFHICEDPLINKNVMYNKLYKIEEISEIPKRWITKYHPKKNAEYYKKRYKDHPFYHYKIFGIFREEILLSAWVVRETNINGYKCLRLVDMAGDIENQFDIEGNVQELLREYDAEFIDCYNYGIDEEYFTAMGFNNVDGDTVIPNYFEPFEKKNVDIHYAYYSKSPIVIFKGDADQDRPNLLDEL